MKKPSLRPTVAAVAAAALLVVGTDVVTYAATGDSLILGKANKAGATTTVANTGRGPALELKTGKKFPPLKVSSSKRVAKLNADTVDGRDSTVLEPAILEFNLGAKRSVVGPRTARELDVPPGTYQITMSGLLTELEGNPDPNVICYLGDTRLFDVTPPDLPDSDLAYLAHSADFGDDFQSIFGYADVVRVPAGAQVFLGCFYGNPGDPAEIEQTKPVRATFRPVPALVSGTQRNFTLPGRAVRDIQRSTR